MDPGGGGLGLASANEMRVVFLRMSAWVAKTSAGRRMPTTTGRAWEAKTVMKALCSQQQRRRWMGGEGSELRCKPGMAEGGRGANLLKGLKF